jgi:hypothetical protein
MKWIVLAGILLVTPAYAEVVCPKNDICPTCKPICYQKGEQVYYPPNIYEWTSATWANAPRWLKQKCPHYRFQTYLPSRDICR